MSSIAFLPHGYRTSGSSIVDAICQTSWTSDFNRAVQRMVKMTGALSKKKQPLIYQRSEGEIRQILECGGSICIVRKSEDRPFGHKSNVTGAFITVAGSNTDFIATTTGIPIKFIETPKTIGLASNIIDVGNQKYIDTNAEAMKDLGDIHNCDLMGTVNAESAPIIQTMFGIGGIIIGAQTDHYNAPEVIFQRPQKEIPVLKSSGIELDVQKNFDTVRLHLEAGYVGVKARHGRIVKLYPRKNKYTSLSI